MCTVTGSRTVHARLMREALHLTANDARRLPWKNGRGFTEELALWPEGSTFERGDFHWRISTAAIDEPGPFSLFTGFDRILVVTQGDGLVLSHADRAARTRVRRLEPYLFSGDWPTTAELAGGAVADFNVIYRRASLRADVEVLKLSRRRVREGLDAGDAFVHVLEGRLTARLTGGEEPFGLATRESLWAREVRDGDELDILGGSEDCLALLVRILARELE